jgi:hypothetical protein
MKLEPTHAPLQVITRTQYNSLLFMHALLYSVTRERHFA